MLLEVVSEKLILTNSAGLFRLEASACRDNPQLSTQPKIPVQRQGSYTLMVVTPLL